jgi:2-dehydropantoate 2-reductase
VPDNHGKIAVMGAGAVGCYYGGMLARAGEDVTFIGRASHVEAINRDGLLLETRDFSARIAASASTDAAAVAGARLVLFCVKSTATDEAASEIAPHLAPDALVLGLQNGVDNFERLQRATDKLVIPAVVYVAATMAGSGHVRHNGGGNLVIGVPDGRSDPALHTRLAEIVPRLGAAGIGVTISDNVVGELWTKLTINCAYNALSAVTRSRYEVLGGSEYARRIMGGVVEEILAVAVAKGIHIPDQNLAETVYRVAAAMPNATSSTEQDLARGQTTEIDHLNGYIAREGDTLAIPTPVNRTLHALVKMLEAALPPRA